MYISNFEPAKNKEGFSIGTFLGLEKMKGISKTSGNPYSMTLVKFETKGRVMGTTGTISIATNGQDELIAALTSMGWKPTKATKVTDELGQIQEVFDYDSFIQEAIGQKYQFNVTRNSKGRYQVERGTVQPFKMVKQYTKMNLTQEQATTLIKTLSTSMTPSAIIKHLWGSNYQKGKAEYNELTS